jgi:hypothetical protein
MRQLTLLIVGTLLFVCTPCLTDDDYVAFANHFSRGISMQTYPLNWSNNGLNHHCLRG